MSKEDFFWQIRTWVVTLNRRVEIVVGDRMSRSKIDWVGGLIFEPTKAFVRMKTISKVEQLFLELLPRGKTRRRPTQRPDSVIMLTFWAVFDVFFRLMVKYPYSIVKTCVDTNNYIKQRFKTKNKTKQYNTHTWSSERLA